MVTFGAVVQRRSFSRPPLVGAIILMVVIACSVAVLTNNDSLQGIEAQLGIPGKPPVAYTFLAGHIVRIDPSTGAILAQASDLVAEQFPSLAVSHDGQSLFVLHSELHDGEYQDQLLTLSTSTLALQASAPVQHFMRPMESWPPALAVTSDDRMVVVSQYGRSDSDPYWLSYYNRQTGRFAVDSTILWGCGVSQLLPFDEQVAVLCLGAGDLRFVDLQSHKVTATLTPGVTPDGVLGSAIAAGIIPGQRALAVVLDRGSLVRIDLVTHAISLTTDLVSPNSEFAPRWADFSANGRVAVLLGRVDGTGAGPLPLLIVDSTNGRILDRLYIDTLYPAVTMAPDGQRVYVLTDSGGLQEVDLATHRLRSFGPDPANTWVHLVFADR